MFSDESVFANTYKKKYLAVAEQTTPKIIFLVYK